MDKVERVRFSDDDKNKMLKKTGGKCAHCGKKLTLKTMTVDHMYPINKGGDNSEFNLVAMCENCNNEKSNFIYDLMSYFHYILPAYRDEYEKLLWKNTFSKSNSKSIFGDVIRRSYIMDHRSAQMLNKTRKLSNPGAVLRSLGRLVEIRRMYEGDIDENVVNLFNKGTEKMNLDSLDIYKLRGIANKTSFYGAYMGDKILAVSGYCHIDSINTDENKEKIIELAKQHNYDDIYINCVWTIDSKFSMLVNAFYDSEVAFSSMTNKLVIAAENNYNRALHNGLNGHVLCKCSIDDTLGVSTTFWLTDDDAFYKFLDNCNTFKERLGLNKEE